LSHKELLQQNQRQPYLLITFAAYLQRQKLALASPTRNYTLNMTLAQSFRFPKPSKLKKNVLLQETIESLIKNTKLKERINSPALPQTPKTPNESIVKDVDDILEDRRSKVRFSDPEIPKEKIPTKQYIMN
jgi:hypothetical protein